MLSAIFAGASLAFLIGDYIYHRFNETAPHQQDRDVRLPRTEEGTPIPILLGRTLVREPFLAWGYVTELVAPASARSFMLFSIAADCDDGNGRNRVHNMWMGDSRLDSYYSYSGPVDADGNWLQTGNGGPEASITLAGVMYIETLNGNPAQVLAHDSSTTSDAPTYAGRAMLTYMPWGRSVAIVE